LRPYSWPLREEERGGRLAVGMTAGAVLENPGSLAPDKKTLLGRRPSRFAPELLVGCSSRSDSGVAAALL